MNLLVELELAQSGLNDLFETKGSFQKIGLGDLLIELAQGVASDVTSFNGRNGAVVPIAGDYNTDLVTEASNLYFTNARVLSSTLTGYVSAPGTITASDTVLSAIQKLNGNMDFDFAESIHTDGTNSPTADINWGGFSISNIISLQDASQIVSINLFSRNLNDASGAPQFAWSSAGIAINATKGLRFNSDSDPNWQIGLNLGIVSHPHVATNILQFVVGASSGDGFAFGNTNGDVYLELDSSKNAWFANDVNVAGNAIIGSLNGVLKASAGLVSGSATTSDLPEGSNLYYLDSRARLAISSLAPVDYNNVTGVISMHVADATHDGFLSQSDWNRFNAESGIEDTVTTPDNIPVAIYSAVLPNTSVWYLEARVTARYADGSAVEVFHKNVGVRAEISGSPSIISPGPTTIYESDGVVLSVDWVINGSSIELQVTGDASASVNWKSFVSIYAQND